MREPAGSRALEVGFTEQDRGFEPVVEACLVLVQVVPALAVAVLVVAAFHNLRKAYVANRDVLLNLPRGFSDDDPIDEPAAGRRHRLTAASWFRHHGSRQARAGAQKRHDEKSAEAALQMEEHRL